MRYRFALALLTFAVGAMALAPYVLADTRP